MAFFSVPSQPVRINARAFLGLEPTPPSNPADDEQEAEVKDGPEKPPEMEEKPLEVADEGKSPALAKDSEASRKRHGRREPTERAKRWRKRRKKRRVTGHVTGGAVVERHAALPVVSIEGASSDEDEDGDVDLADVEDDELGNDHDELKSADVVDADNENEQKDSVQNVYSKDEQLETDSSSGPEKSRTSQEVVLSEEKCREPEVTVGQESHEEASVTICDAADDLSSSDSEIVDELCIGGDDDNDDNDTDEVEYLADGRTINYDKYFAEESENNREDLENDLCSEEQQQIVDDVVSSFREIGDAQPPADVANLPLTQSEERLLMFGWKEGMEDENGDDLGKDREDTRDVAKVEDDASGAEKVKGITLEVKNDAIDKSVTAARSSASSSPSEHKQSRQPSSKSSDQAAVAPVPAEKLAPRAEVDSFSDEDLDLCVVVPSYRPAPVGVSSGAPVDNEVPAVAESIRGESQNLETSSNLDSLLAGNTNDSANLSDIVLANVSTDPCQQTVADTSKPEFNTDSGVKISAKESVQTSMPRDSNQQPSELLIARTDTDTVAKAGGSDIKEDLTDSTSPVKSSPVCSPVTPSSADTSKCAKLDPLARIDRLLESLSSARVAPLSPSLLSSDDVFVPLLQQSGKPEMNSDVPKLEHSVSPSSRLERLADTSASDHTADVRDESRVVEFKVEDASGVERSFTVDESYVNTRDKRQFSEKESLSDVSFSATDSAADASIMCRNTDESSSSGTREVATCPAALMAATDDSLSLDRLASFSFDDSLSADNILDGEVDLAEVEPLSDAKHPQHVSAKPVCNGTVHNDTDSFSKPQRIKLHATVADAASGKDSPPVAVVSPSRLVDAKRRFFCEPPQPVRIDPRRVFDEIPATPFSSSVSVPEGASADQVNGLSSEDPAMVDNSSSGHPRRRVLPGLPLDQQKLDISQLVLSAEELALIKNAQQRAAQSGEKNKSAQSPVAADDATLVQRRPHRSEKKRPSSALVVTATEREKMDSSVVVRPPPHTGSSTSKPSVPQRQSSHSDSTTDGSPGQRRERMWAFHRPKSKTKTTVESTSGGDVDNSAASDRKEKRRSLLALLMPSKSLDRREKPPKDMPPVSPQQSAVDATTVEPSVDRTEIIAAVREKTKSLPLEKKKLPSSDAVQRSSLEKQRSKSSRSRAAKKSASEGDGRPKQTQRTVYEEMAPIIEGIKRVERRNREKVNIHDRIRAVAPPPAKAPHTALLPPKADSKCQLNYLCNNYTAIHSIGRDTKSFLFTFLCKVTDLLARALPIGVKFCTAVRPHLGQVFSSFGGIAPGMAEFWASTGPLGGICFLLKNLFCLWHAFYRHLFTGLTD